MVDFGKLLKEHEEFIINHQSCDFRKDDDCIHPDSKERCNHMGCPIEKEKRRKGR